MKNTISALALLTLAGSAMAQPAAFTDLGNRTTTQNFTQDVTLAAPNDIQWFRIVLPPVSPAAGHIDIWTNLVGDITDTEIGLYAANGNFATGAAASSSDDDDGPGLSSLLTYGMTTPRTPLTGTTVTPRNGRDGSLTGGVYYLAFGRYNVTFVTGFGATSSNALVQSTGQIQFDISAPTDPTPPTGTGAAQQSGSTLLLTVTTAGGFNPNSTAITVTGDLSALGGGSSVAFLDNGTNGDATSGDGIYSYTVSTASLPEGPTAVPFTVADAQGRSSTGTINASVDAFGQSIATANIPSGTGSLSSIAGFLGTSDVDLFKINICDFASFSATTVGTGVAFNDTQLFLFNTDGVGVTFNDDSVGLYSTITALNLTANGDYYLAISHYDIDPVDSSDQALWIDTPFGTERAPDGPGMSNPLANWTGTNTVTDSGTYTIALTGACFPSAGPLCGPADIGSTGGTPGADGRLDNNDFIVFIDRFFANAPSADIGTTGGSAGSDGLWNNNDFIVFIDQFFNGPASCR